MIFKVRLILVGVLILVEVTNVIGGISVTNACASRVSAYPPDPKDHCCGQSATDTNIVRKPIGPAKLDEFPWLALVEYESGGDTRIHCSGVLISGKYVLAPAHCLVNYLIERGTPKSVRLGDFHIHSDVDCSQDDGYEDCVQANETISIPIEQTIVHPQYDPRTRPNDIALIRLKELAPYTRFIRPICLPTADDELSPPQEFINAGWLTFTKIYEQSLPKSYALLPFVKLEDCQKEYSTLTLWNGQICAEQRIEHCNGMSDGPIMFERKNGAKAYEVIGLRSLGSPSCLISPNPAVFTKVYEYNDWIKNNILP